MSRIKGAAIRARLEYVRDKHGEQGLQDVISTMDDMDQVILTGTVLPSIWYPFQVLSSFDAAACRVLGDGNPEIFEAAGAHVARQHARSIYRVFFRESEPVRVLRLATCIFANYYSGLGQLSLRSGPEGDTQRLIVSGAPGAARSNCLTSLAYFRTVLEACTDLGVRAREARCQCWGDDVCEFEFAWQEVTAAVAAG